MKPVSSTHTILILTSFLMLSIIGYLLYLMVTTQTTEPSLDSSSVTATPTTAPTLTNTPTMTITTSSSPTPSNSPTPTKESDLVGITNAFASKYSKPPSDVEVSISQNTGTHAWGGISFAGEMGGGWFLAYKGENGWIIVADGNGTISCSKIEPYNFPASIVPECYDEKTDTLIKRK